MQATTRLVLGLKAREGGVEIRLPDGQCVILGITRQDGSWISLAMITPANFEISRLKTMREGDYEETSEEDQKRLQERKRQRQKKYGLLADLPRGHSEN